MKYPAFVYLQKSIDALHAAHSADAKVFEGVLKEGKKVIAVDDVLSWLRESAQHFETKAITEGFTLPMPPQGFGPGPRDEKGQFRKRANPNN